MGFIDAKFKDKDPRDTVSQLKTILAKLDLDICEQWNDSGVENCHSVRVYSKKGLPSTTGKGVSADFALASGYAEFIERIQSGLYMAGHQSLHRDKEMDLHTYAPDKRYMTVDELILESDWMDHIISAYPQLSLTRQSIAEYCLAYSCADDGLILTVPFYSLFEDKYAYFPTAFVERMYSANGNCAGNTKQEAWVHALSEMMERYASQKMLLSGKAAPRIPEQTLMQFPTVARILEQVRRDGTMDIAVFDYSIGNGFPVISTRIISKTNQNYHVNVAADPVLEIAIQRTLTELFQGRGVDRMTSRHNGAILKDVKDFPAAYNSKNQLQSSDGLYTADYFADELTCTAEPAQFPDNSGKTNKELLGYMLQLYRDLNRPVYVRNYSFLGFQSYKFVVPGFSETGAYSLGDPIAEYSLGDMAHGTFRDPVSATDEDLQWMLRFSAGTKQLYGRYQVYSVNAGVPMVGAANSYLCSVVRAYGAYRLGQYDQARVFTQQLMQRQEFGGYYSCVEKYLSLKEAGIEEDKIRSILYKFFPAQHPAALYEKLDQGLSPYEDQLIRCDLNSCDSCRYQQECCYRHLRALTARVGGYYSQFTQGQEKENFQY